MKELDFDIFEILNQRICQGNYTLPSIPEASLRLMNLLSDSDTSLEELEKTVGMDPILASQILKIANSCISGAIVEVTSLKNALMRLGRKHIRSIVMMLSIKASIIKSKTFLGPMKQIWSHSISSAFLKRYVAKKFKEEPEESFTVGLLHNMGKLILLSLLNEMLQESAQEISEDFLGQIYIAHHLEITKKLLSAWKISPKIIQIIALQDSDIESIKNSPLSESDQKMVFSLILISFICKSIEENLIKEKFQQFSSLLSIDIAYLEDILKQKEKIAEEILPFI
ncbi:MAG: HDOD domain-containing protein [Candidatus Brocadiae bacterium]|nr:HDOD domain-containing protein [Candidatus Brocadiia bacterium]